MYTIDKSIPYPTITTRGKPLTEERKIMGILEIGESFFLEGIQPLNKARGASLQLKPKKFSMLKEKDGFRCWRIK